MSAPPASPDLRIVDAFSDRPFAGNPAAVCQLDGPADATWMQALAGEMNLPETAFVRPLDRGFELRWFAPGGEVDLCGHATLATAHVLWETGRAPAGEAIAFSTRSGILTARQDGDWIALDFPATPAEPAEAPPELLRALGVEPLWVGRSPFDWLLELESPEAVAAASPDMARLGALPGRGTILTAAGGPDGADICSRFFAPAIGVPEDPVTGSAHCALGPYWAPRLGRDRLVARQLSPRGGLLRVGVGAERVELAGQAVTVLEGRLAGV